MKNEKVIILAEEKFSPLESKTANAAIIYLTNQVLAVIDSTQANKTSQDVLGYGGSIPVLKSIEEGLKLKPTALLIGIAPPGGRLPESWKQMIRTSLENGLNIYSGLHTILNDDEEFKNLAKKYNCKITDWRKIPERYEVVTNGNYLTRNAKTILSVGVDCNIGKMTTTLQIYHDFLKKGFRADFIGTGQTGIMISGKGIAVDSIISDYIAGGIELCIDESDKLGFDFIFVEGQGALTHHGYSGVTMGLIHGTMPDAMILCHQPTRKVDNYNLPLPSLKKLIDLHEGIVKFFKETKIVGVGLNSIGLSDEESMRVADEIQKETGLPTIDTFRFGAEKISNALLKYFGK